MSFFGHLEELRGRIFKAAIGVALGCIGAAFFTDTILQEVLLRPAQKANMTLQNVEMFGQAFLKIRIIFTTGIIVAFPWLLWQVWSFVAPGLYSHERRWVGRITFFTSVCFLTGVAFAYYLLVPSMMAYSHAVADPGIKDDINISSYFSFMINMFLASGLMFEMPMIAWVLARIGVLRPELMTQYRRHSIVVIMVLAAVITPSPDPVNQLMVAVPLYFLYELSAVLAKVAYRVRRTDGVAS